MQESRSQSVSRTVRHVAEREGVLTSGTEAGTAHGSCDFLTPLLVTLWCLAFPRVLSPSCGRVLSLVTSCWAQVKHLSENHHPTLSLCVSVSRVSRVSRVCLRVSACVRVSVSLCLCVSVSGHGHGHGHVYVYVFVYVYMYMWSVSGKMVNAP